MAAALAMSAGAAAAQPPALGVEADRDRFTYHFDNPSSFDTPGLVPHSFEQRYVADNLWLTGTLRYRAGVEWETAGGVTPRRSATGDDYDTFFEPDGSVIVSGTTGGISIWSWRASQRFVAGSRGPVALLGGYRVRADRADWQLGHSTTRRDGALIDAHDTADREYTQSYVHEIVAAIRVRPEARRAWETAVDVEVAPVVAGRLTVQLPDKYPDTNLLFLAKGAAASASLSLAHGRGPIPFTVTVFGQRRWSDHADAELSGSAFGIRVTIR